MTHDSVEYIRARIESVFEAWKRYDDTTGCKFSIGIPSSCLYISRENGTEMLDVETSVTRLDVRTPCAHNVWLSEVLKHIYDANVSAKKSGRVISFISFDFVDFSCRIRGYRVLSLQLRMHLASIN